MTEPQLAPTDLVPDPALDSKTFKKPLMDRLRARGGTASIDTKQLFQSMVKETIEAFLELEMEEHLGYPKHDPEGRGSGNSRNGATEKTVRGDFGEVQIETPRDRQSSFDPKIVGNWRLGRKSEPRYFRRCWLPCSRRYVGVQHSRCWYPALP